MSDAAGTILFVFSLIALGYLAALAGLLKAETGDALADFTVAVAIPALLFRTMANAHFGDASPLLLWATYFCAVAVTWAIGEATVVRLFGRERRFGVIGGLSASFSNLAMLGIPIIHGIHGEAGFTVLSVILSVHLPFMMTLSTIEHEWVARGAGLNARALLAGILRNLVRNPLIIGILSGLAFRATGLGLPDLPARIVDGFAGVAGTIAAFSLGLSLRKFSLSGNVRPALALSAVKLLVLPTAALGFALLFGLPSLPARVVLTGAALPTGLNVWLIAMRFGVGQALSANTMMLTMLAGLASLAFWTHVAEMVFG